jgi:hypothetical protein
MKKQNFKKFILKTNPKLSHDDLYLLVDIVDNIDSFEMDTLNKTDIINLALHVSTIAKILLKTQDVDYANKNNKSKRIKMKKEIREV